MTAADKLALLILRHRCLVKGSYVAPLERISDAGGELELEHQVERADWSGLAFGGEKVCHLESYFCRTPRETTDGINALILSVFPNFIRQQVENSIAMCQSLPKDVGKIEFNWTLLGFEDDDEDLTRVGLRQANLVGRVGYISQKQAKSVASSNGRSAASGGDAGLMEKNG